MGTAVGRTLERPLERTQYPEKWRVWEEELLASILSGHPDAITFTAYEELRAGA